MISLDHLKAICPRTPAAKLEPFVAQAREGAWV